MSRSEHDWVLWVDWCAATDHRPGEVTETALAAFSAALPRARPRGVLTAARRRGLARRRSADPWTSAETHWASVEQSLTRCPVYGWPQAVPGRRDAWLIVATRVLRLRRAHAVGLRARDIPWVLDRLDSLTPGSPTADQPCLRCVVGRWLHTVDLQDRWSRSAVRAEVWARPAAPTGQVGCDHTCRDVEAIHARLPAHAVLAPAIDQHGWWVDWRPMTPRALTTVLATRCDPYAADPPAPPQPLSVEHLDPAVFDDTTFERLDEAMSAADEVNARMQAIFAEHDRPASSS